MLNSFYTVAFDNTITKLKTGIQLVDVNQRQTIEIVSTQESKQLFSIYLFIAIIYILKVN